MLVPGATGVLVAAAAADEVGLAAALELADGEADADADGEAALVESQFGCGCFTENVKTYGVEVAAAGVNGAWVELGVGLG